MTKLIVRFPKLGVRRTRACEARLAEDRKELIRQLDVLARAAVGEFWHSPLAKMALELDEAFDAVGVEQVRGRLFALYVWLPLAVQQRLRLRFDEPLLRLEAVARTLRSRAEEQQIAMEREERLSR